MPCRSEALLTTMLWPITFTSIWPVCFSVMLNSLHDAGTTMEPTSNCMRSLPSIVVAQSATTAAGLPSAAGAGAGVVASAGVGAAGSGAGAALSGAVASGADAASAVASEARSPQADRARAQHAASRVVLKCIGGSPGKIGANDPPWGRRAA